MEETGLGPRSHVSDLTTGWLARALVRLDCTLIEISHPDRIGHLCLEPDSFLKERRLEGRRRGPVFLLPTGVGFANRTLLRHLRRHLVVVSNPRLARRLRAAFERAGRIEKTHPHAVALYDTARCFEVYARWGTRAPLFALTRDDIAFRDRMLREMGVPDGAWFVCVHAREGGYSPSDENVHSYRNVDIADYGPAMDRIVARGGWCIRMGDPTMKPLGPREGVVDYATSPFKSERLDICLAAGCRFFLGCASGLYNVAAMFGRPSALANTAPLSAAYSQGVGDLAIPQLLARGSGEILSFEDILGSEIGNLRLTHEFVDRGLVPRNVTSGEIVAMTEEMIETVEGRVRYGPEDQARQDAYRSLYRQGHYAFRAGSRIGRDFLARHFAAGISRRAEPITRERGSVPALR